MPAGILCCSQNHILSLQLPGTDLRSHSRYTLYVIGQHPGNITSQRRILGAINYCSLSQVHSIDGCHTIGKNHRQNQSF